MSDASAFHQAILADVDNDQPRLVYADWLEEHGDPLGAFIRIQCEMAQLYPFDPRFEELTIREQQMLKSYGREWSGGPDINEGVNRPGNERGGLQLGAFTRGFIETLRAAPGRFIEQGEQLWDTAPVLHQLEFTRGAATDHLFESPLFQRVQVLTLPRLLPFSDRIQTDFVTLEDLAGVQAPLPLTTLRLEAVPLAQYVLSQLLNNPALSKLHTIQLSGCSGGRFLAEAIAGNRPRRQFREIAAPFVCDGEAGSSEEFVAQLCGAAQTSTLQRLNLASNFITPKALQHLTQRTQVTPLESLNISHNETGNHGMEMIAASASLQNLKHLNLYRTGIGARGAMVLAQSPAMRTLQTLDLGANNLGNEGLAVLASVEAAGSEPLPLKRLQLAKCGVSSIEAYLHRPLFQNLRFLSLAYNELDERAVAVLCQPGVLPHVARLVLWGNNISDAGRKQLVKHYGRRIWL